MYYSSVAAIALIVHFIINFEALKRIANTSTNETRKKYRHYLIAITTFYVSDALWGFVYDQRWITATYIVTCTFFLSMVVSVLLWTRAVVSFTKSKGRLGKVLIGCGWTIVTFQIVILIINIFKPIVFSFSADKEYQALPSRYIALLMQMVLFFASAIYALVTAIRSTGEKRTSYRTVGFSSIIMAVFIALQMLYPLMPLYSLGCLFGTCMIHTFVYRDRNVAYEHNMELAAQKAYKDGLTGVKNKLAYLETLADIESSIENGSLTEYGVVVFDLNGLKQINDTLGHEAGDEYIKSACMLICKQFDHSPVFRVGGDEFVAILKGVDYERREELESSFRQKIDENQRDGQVVVSSGMAVYQADTDSSYNDVFKRADGLMYARKQELKQIAAAT